MHRAIVLSNAYRLSNAIDPADSERDTGNTAYWRADRRPLDAEACATRCSTSPAAGPVPSRSHPFPPEKSWAFTAHHQFKAVYPSDHRSVYLMVQRLHPHPYLALFNGPDASTTTAVRDEGFLPLHGALLAEQSVRPRTGRRVRPVIDREPDTRARIRLAYVMTYARPPRRRNQPGVGLPGRYEQALADEGIPAGRGRSSRGRAWCGRSWRPMSSSLWIDRRPRPGDRAGRAEDGEMNPDCGLRIPDSGAYDRFGISN